MAGNDGRFKTGAGGPGRPPRERERAYLEATVSACPVGEWTKIVRRAVADAVKGNAVARRWLSDILIGRDPVALRVLLDEVRDALEALNRG